MPVTPSLRLARSIIGVTLSVIRKAAFPAFLRNMKPCANWKAIPEREKTGEYPAQVNVYEGITRNWETELDEYTATGDVLRLDVGDSGEITVPDGWFIELHEPDKVWLVRTGDAPEAVEPEIVEPVSEPKPAPEKVDASLDDCIGLIKTALENSFENCDVYLHDSGHVLSIDVWRDGLTQTAFLAYGGNQEALDSWNANVSTGAIAITKSAQNVLDTNGHSDVTVLFRIISDVEKDKSLLMATKGEVVFDAANGVNRISEFTG